MPQRPPSEASADFRWERDTPPPDSRGAKWTLGTSGGKRVTGATKQNDVPTTDYGPVAPRGVTGPSYRWGGIRKTYAGNLSGR